MAIPEDEITYVLANYFHPDSLRKGETPEQLLRQQFDVYPESKEKLRAELEAALANASYPWREVWSLADEEAGDDAEGRQWAIDAIWKKFFDNLP